MESNTEEPTFTHKATLTVYSNGDDDMVSVKMVWDPDLTGMNIQDLGYLPASYQMVEEFLLPALEEAYMKSEVEPMMAMESPSQRKH